MRDYEKIYDDFIASGKSIKQYCDENDLNYQYLVRKIREIRKSREMPADQIIELVDEIPQSNKRTITMVINDIPITVTASNSDDFINLLRDLKNV